MGGRAIRRRRHVRLGAAAVMAGTVLSAGIASAPRAAASTVGLNRVAGSDRYQTSAKIAEAKYPTGVPGGAVVVATGANFPDALAGNYLAGQLGAPILLCPGSASDPAFATTTAALKALGATRVYLLGGAVALGDDVQAALAQRYRVTRIAGATRFDTMQQADTQPGVVPGAGASGARTAIIATGGNFPDALAAGPLAWADKFPVILTDGASSTLSPQATAAINSLAISHFIVMGGPASINPAQVTQLQSYGTIDEQFAGADRTDTAAQFAAYAQSTYSFATASVILTSGADFPDALSAGPWGGDTQSIYLSESAHSLGSYTTAALAALAGRTLMINIAGGVGAVDDNAASSAQSASAITSGGSGSTVGPTVTTEAATGVTATTATLNARVDPNGLTTSYSFEYGANGVLAPSAAIGTLILPGTPGAQAVSAGVAGLTSGTVYSFRVVATNANGTTYGQTLTFTAATPSAPAVSSLSVTGGSTSGGTQTTLSGTDLNGATSVTFGGAAALGITVNSSTSLTVTAPPGTPGRVDVRVTTPLGTSAIARPADEYTFVAPPVMVSAVVATTPAPGSVTVTYDEPVSCPTTGLGVNYTYSNGGPFNAVGFLNCVAVSGAPNRLVLTTNGQGIGLNPPTASDTLSYALQGYSPASTSNSTYAPAGNGGAFANSQVLPL